MAGIVGLAELLCAALFLSALLLYMASVEEPASSQLSAGYTPREKHGQSAVVGSAKASQGRAEGTPGGVPQPGIGKAAGRPGLPPTWQPFAMLAIALATVFCAALAKELGITAVGGNRLKGQSPAGFSCAS